MAWQLLRQLLRKFVDGGRSPVGTLVRHVAAGGCTLDPAPAGPTESPPVDASKFMALPTTAVRSSLES